MTRRREILTLLFVGLAASLPTAVVRAELVGHWGFDRDSGSTAVDSSGHGNDGILVGEPARRPAPSSGGMLEFDGVDDYVRTGFVLNPADGPLSAFAWVKGGAAGQIIISQASGTGIGRTWLCADPVEGKLMTRLADAGRFPRLLKSDSVITDGKWHHVGLSIGVGPKWMRRSLYVDGVVVATDDEPLHRLQAADGGLLFGAEENLGQGKLWRGVLDEVRIYDHALDAPQVEQVMRTDSRDAVDVVVLAPKALYADSPATVSVSAVGIASRGPVVVPVAVSLRQDDSATLRLFEGVTGEHGKVTAQFATPDVPPGPYVLEVEVEGVSQAMTAQVQVRQMPVILIETDKPIYKPGQTIQGRVLVLSNQLRPTTSEASVEITDGKGVKIFREALTTNAFGVAPFELDLASELNYGTWKITAESGLASGSVDVRVEEYVLPRFEVELVTEKDYFLVDEEITGVVSAAYFFGKVIDGTVEVRASRYIGVWEEYASYTATLSEGRADFELPAVEYVSGTPGAGGSGSVQLEVVVTDTSGHEEETTKLLKIVESTIQHQLIASSRSITPGQPFDVLLVAETPDNEPVSVSAEITCEYFDEYYGLISEEKRSLSDVEGLASVSFTAAKRTAWAWLHSKVKSDEDSAETDLTVYASYSPTDSFLHLSRASNEPVSVGDTVTIDVFQTHDATVYYDVFSSGHTVWSDATTGSQIVFQATVQMVPAAKVVAYVINPNNEISADVLPLEVTVDSTAELDVVFDSEEVGPGDSVRVSVQADAQAMVGLAIVDESVYALNEGRLNMQEVFNELERRFMDPQSETHAEAPCGAYEVFDEMGLQVLVSERFNVPQRPSIWDGLWWFDVVPRGGGPLPPAWRELDGSDKNVPLAEVSRVRQFFPETWLWLPDLLTEPDGSAAVDLTAPDSITTWRLHAVSTSSSGLGISESELLVFQEFFGEPDLPYAVTRGEQFPVRIQIFNYLDTAQLVHVKLAEAGWFELLEPGKQQVLVGPSSVGLASFLIRPIELGRNTLEVTLRSTQRADAVRKELLVEAEGTEREIVTNGMLRAGETLSIDSNMPSHRVPGSEKLLLSVTPSLVAQSINGIEDLLHMPYGCGEQNMIFFAPDVEILRYLDATGQLTPEVRAKAEHFITVGYQRELTYRRQDGSFSAFGDSDESGSLWLTAFVLDCFSGARDVQTIDETVLADAAHWIESHQLADGSWEPIGFVHHQEMIGGVSGNFTLTAFVMIALADYGMATAQGLAGATEYLVDNLSTVQDDAYALAVAALALARVDSPAAEQAIDRLLEISISDGDGIHWEPHAIETTAYAALAMIETEKPQANSAIKWLALQQNGRGGFCSTQDTVMALKALMTAARVQSRNVSLAVTAKSPDGAVIAELTVDASNFDVLQIVELPDVDSIELSAAGSGETRYQLVRRFNVLLRDETVETNMALEVTYDADHVEVDDIVTVTATVRYFGREGSSGMMIVDVGVPTGFAPVRESLEALAEQKIVSRFEVAGRKVILYVDDLTPGEERTFTFQVKARFPVRAIIPDSKAYLYYEPDVRAEDAGREITVGSPDCTVDFDYLARFSSEWLASEAGPGTDLNGSGRVDFEDFSVLAQDWLDTCSQ